MGFLSSLDITGSALTAERFRSDIILQNIANVDTTETEAGGPYRRKQLVFSETPMSFRDELDKVSGGVQVSKVVESDKDFQPVYDPTNPNADENGYVLHSNVDTTEEMVDLMAASNAYSVNLTALSVTKAMIDKTLKLGE
jgi:flagellar basal-body rod protein FlgC